MFKDKVVLVTGSSQGIGRAIAIKFAQFGAKIALNDISLQEENLKKVQEEIKTLGGEAKYFLADVSKMEDVKKMMEDIQKEFGRLDVLVNNAGITKDRTLAKMSQEEWQKVIDVNLTSVFNCSQSALPLLIQNQGSIISLSSVSAQRGNFGQTNYCASKAGIIGFTKTLSKEVGKFGIRVNAVMPGFIESKMADATIDMVKVMVKQLTPLGRFGKPEEVASVIAFLASPEASFITGAAIPIDGGLY
jgi:3-oxoacyl-[acyl-carrier protein] reductase